MRPNPFVSGVHRDTALFFTECTPNNSSREGEASVQPIAYFVLDDWEVNWRSPISTR